jgi:5-methyltetrahydrofolate--homocysteine methyltransferase
MGELEVDRAYELFMEQAVAGEMAGADFAAIETMSDLEELKAAISAVRENTKLPVLATMTFNKAGYTFTGCTPELFAEAAEGLGASAVGINCSLEPVEMFSTAERIARATKLPLIVKPNAGLPDGVSGLYGVGPEEFASQMAQYASIGVKIVGGCCGTTPDYIRELRATFLGM